MTRLRLVPPVVPLPPLPPPAPLAARETGASARASTMNEAKKSAMRAAGMVRVIGDLLFRGRRGSSPWFSLDLSVVRRGDIRNPRTGEFRPRVPPTGRARYKTDPTMVLGSSVDSRT